MVRFDYPMLMPQTPFTVIRVVKRIPELDLNLSLKSCMTFPKRLTTTSVSPHDVCCSVLLHFSYNKIIPNNYEHSVDLHLKSTINLM